MLEIELQRMSQQLQERFAPKPSKPQKKKRRKLKKTAKKDKIIRTTFKRTPLGDFLIRNCPEEYELITKTRTEGVGITADLVEMIAYRSDNPSFQTVAFRRALTDYRRYKCRTPNKVAFNIDAEIETIKRKLKLSENAEIL